MINHNLATMLIEQPDGTLVLPQYIVVFDTETTGFPSGTKPRNDPTQARACQIGAGIYDTHNDWKELCVLDIIVQVPFIPEPVAAIHGISTEMSEALGVNEATAVVMFLDLTKDYPLVAHNAKFDQDILANIMSRAGLVEEMEAFLEREIFCTMHGSVDYAKVPVTEKQAAKGMTGFKTPNLSEAVLNLTGEPLENAHNAMADVRGCKDVLRKTLEIIVGELNGTN